jgi:Monogalactosyldiacylglycerol (MGDG) synthase.
MVQLRELLRICGNLYGRFPLLNQLINEFIEFTIKEKFLGLLEKVKPDLILSVHPNFNGSVINIMEENNIKIPFITLIADLISIYPLWADPRVDFIISPTLEAKEKCIEYGVPEAKIKIFGFPVRSKIIIKKRLLIVQNL